jgi:hypothetical protein
VGALLLLTGFLFSLLRGTSSGGRLTTLITVFVFLGSGTAHKPRRTCPPVECALPQQERSIPGVPADAVENVMAFFMPLSSGESSSPGSSAASGRRGWALYAHGDAGLLCWLCWHWRRCRAFRGASGNTASSSSAG